ncbi:hypothetical protein WH96_09920 [Kiloniella spongiae]|uniref:Nitronate monooxygenase n=1 Tax=Kiloniella spongiae TaxID=1489064 RepID=A0A0H2MEY4_9PROT|nr:nitronate monooxygenase [Kiloniella spongiae]KLN60786.1 hypothetical protein WH96_09920 [Kiloniella spongiae]
MALPNKIASLFDIELPIIQAPMAGSSGIEMALSVSKIGGLGSLACATMDVEQLETHLLEMKGKTTKPFNVNFFAHEEFNVDHEHNDKWLSLLKPYYNELHQEAPQELTAGFIKSFDEDRCSVLEKICPRVVSFHFGLPHQRLIKRLKDAGMKIISTATTVEEACWLESRGCDAIIAQGYEAGGHRGMFLSKNTHTQIGTMSLVPQIVDAVDIPVIAAGGIADPRGVAAAFILGASAVQVGTAYLHTKESTISPIYRASLKSATAHDTCLSNVFSGRPTRCRMNRFIREHGPISDKSPQFPLGFSAMSALRIEGEQQGKRDFSPHYCGQSVAMKSSESATQLTRDLALKARSLLKGFATDHD